MLRTHLLTSHERNVYRGSKHAEITDKNQYNLASVGWSEGFIHLRQHNIIIDVPKIAKVAAEFGHEKLMRIAFTWGPIQRDDGVFEDAAYGGYLRNLILVRRLQPRSACRMDLSIALAAMTGNFRSIALIHKWGCKSYYHMLQGAVVGRWHRIAKHAMTHGAELNWLHFCIAAELGDVQMLKMMRNLCANFDSVITENGAWLAAKKDNLRVLRLIKKWDNKKTIRPRYLLNRYMEMDTPKKEIIDFLEEWSRL